MSEVATRGSGFDAFGEYGGSGGPDGPRWLMRPLEVMDRLLRWILTAITLVLLVSALIQVTTRYVLQTSFVGPEEIARYLMIAGTFLAIPVLAKSRNHIAVDALRHYLPGRLSVLIVERAILLIEIVFLFVFSYYAGRVVSDLQAAGGASTGLQVPTWIPMAPVLVGALLGAIVTAGLLVQSFLTPAESPDPQGAHEDSPLMSEEEIRP